MDTRINIKNSFKESLLRSSNDKGTQTVMEFILALYVT